MLALLRFCSDSIHLCFVCGGGGGESEVMRDQRIVQ